MRDLSDVCVNEMSGMCARETLLRTAPALGGPPVKHMGTSNIKCDMPQSQVCHDSIA